MTAHRALCTVTADQQEGGLTQPALPQRQSRHARQRHQTHDDRASQRQRS